jgi:hypothetical protein
MYANGNNAYSDYNLLPFDHLYLAIILDDEGQLSCFLQTNINQHASGFGHKLKFMDYGSTH